MAVLVQLPVLHSSDAIELSSGTWRKRLLPIGSVDYKGRTLRFDRPYLETLAKAFTSGAYDQVPFQLADAGNGHTNDPERFRGEVRDMTVDDSGLWITITTTPEGNSLLTSNPRLGVSARIVEDYARSDGHHYPAAVQHVLGTLDPRIPELGAWEPVEFSNGQGADLVIDLSSAAWDGEPGPDDDIIAWAMGNPAEAAQLLELAAGGPHPLSGDLRKLSRRLQRDHPDQPTAADHVSDAADALDAGLHDAARRHLRAAHAMLDPQAMRNNGPEAAQARDEIGRHLLLVQQDRDAQATDRQPSAPADPRVSSPALANDYGYEALEMAAAQQSRVLELAGQQAAQRQAEDARPVRRATGTSVTEDRLSAALRRIGTGTYVPSTAQQALGFANAPAAGMVHEARALAELGSGIGSGCTCADGAMTRYHVLGCPEAELTPDIMGELAQDGTLSEYSRGLATDANGNAWHDQFGQPMGMTALIEAAAGQRLGDGPELGGERREVRTPQRVTRFGDYDDDGDPGRELDGASQRAIASLRSAMGLPDHAAARDQARDAATQRMLQRPATRFRTYGDAISAHSQPLPERHQKVTVGWNDGLSLPGELTGLTWHAPEPLGYL